MDPEAERPANATGKHTGISLYTTAIHTTGVANFKVILQFFSCVRGEDLHE